MGKFCSQLILPTLTSICGFGPEKQRSSFSLAPSVKVTQMRGSAGRTAGKRICHFLEKVGDFITLWDAVTPRGILMR